MSDVVISFVKKPETFEERVARVDAELAAKPMVPAVLRGDWVERTERRGEYAFLEKKAGGALMLDRKSVELACMALGIRFWR